MKTLLRFFRIGDNGKTESFLLGLFGLFFSVNVMAASFHAQLGVYSWYQDPSGYIQYRSASEDFTRVNLPTNAGLEGDFAPYIELTITNTLAVLPNLKLGFSQFDRYGDGQLRKISTSGDAGTSGSSNVHTHLMVEEFSFILFYRPIRRPFTLRIGLMGDTVKGEGLIKSSSGIDQGSGSITMPAVYIGATVPLSHGFSMATQGAWIGYCGDYFDHWQATVNWKSRMGIGVSLGYREETFKVSDQYDPNGKFSFGGLVAGLTYTFGI